MPDKAINKEQKFRMVIYHGHLHKIPIDEEIEEKEEIELITAEE
ncbi:MAG: hypothetical protein ACW96X_08190 [Promethearchaeota archaeon]|jgi:hypothetical protein